MQIIIQKKYIVLYEIAEDIFAVFLVVVNFVFTLVKKVKEVVENISKFFCSFLKKCVPQNKSYFVVKNNNLVKSGFVIYSNLLAPPVYL